MADQEGRSGSQFKLFKWIGAAACALLLGMGVWVFGRAPPAAVPPPKSAEAPFSGPPDINPLESTARARAIVPAASIKAGNVDFCGIGKVTLDGNDSMASYHYLEALTEKTQARWSAALLNSDNLRARAVGLLLQGIGDPKMEQPATQAAHDELVQLAAGAGDPAIYALALQRCNRMNTFADSSSGACPQISWRGWARLDPDNAVPWLMVAGVAHAAHDSAAENDAFNQASKSLKVDAYDDSLFAFSQSTLPDDVTPLQRSYIGTEMIGIEAAAFGPQYSIALHHCSVAAMQDISVKQQCVALAELLINKGTNLIAFGIGEAIGRQAGWPTVRVNALEQEKNALMQSFRQQFEPGDDPNPWSCASVKRFNDYLDLRGRVGEIALARESLERSGESVEELARKWTESIEKMRAKAAEEQAQAPAPEAPAGDASPLQ
jgi:hypothetical protein